MVSDDGKIISGCSGVSLILEDEMQSIKSASFKEHNNKNMTFEFEAIDSTFSLNKEGDCFLWVEQTDEQKIKMKDNK